MTTTSEILNPEEEIAEQNALLIQANKDMIKETENKQISEQAFSVLEDIRNALVTSETRRRIETLETCQEFDDKYKQFLSAIINLTIDENTNIQIIGLLTPTQ